MTRSINSSNVQHVMTYILEVEFRDVFYKRLSQKKKKNGIINIWQMWSNAMNQSELHCKIMQLPNHGWVYLVFSSWLVKKTCLLWLVRSRCIIFLTNYRACQAQNLSKHAITFHIETIENCMLWSMQWFSLAYYFISRRRLLHASFLWI